MNELEEALNSVSNEKLDFYLEVESTSKIRRDIEEIKQKAANETDATRCIAAIQRILSEGIQRDIQPTPKPTND